MPASSPISEELLLDALVRASAVLAGLSLLVWVGCFAVRLRRLRRVAREAAVEERLMGRVLDELAGHPAPPDYFARLPRWEKAVLLRILEDLVGQVRGGDQAKLVALMQRAGFLETALETLHSRRVLERLSAVHVLGHHDQPAALAALRRALDDEDLAVRLTAARALLQKDQVSSLRALLGSLRFSADDPPLMLAEIFARLPASLRDEAVQLLADDIPEEWKRMLAIALGRNQVHEAFAAIAALATASAPRLRAAAWVALRELGDPEAGGLLAAGLADGSATVRRAACRCAGTCGGSDLLNPLAALLDDPDWWVRYEAANALYEFGAEGRMRLEQHSLPAPDDDVGLQVLREREMEATDGG